MITHRHVGILLHVIAAVIASVAFFVAGYVVCSEDHAGVYSARPPVLFMVGVAFVFMSAKVGYLRGKFDEQREKHNGAA